MIETGNSEIMKENVISALKNLTEVWNFLYPTEQHKIAKLLLDEVMLADAGIKIKMNLDGFDRVLREIAQ